MTVYDKRKIKTFIQHELIAWYLTNISTLVENSILARKLVFSRLTRVTTVYDKTENLWIFYGVFEWVQIDYVESQIGRNEKTE